MDLTGNNLREKEGSNADGKGHIFYLLPFIYFIYLRGRTILNCREKKLFLNCHFPKVLIIWPINQETKKKGAMKKEHGFFLLAHDQNKFKGVVL